MRTEKELWEVVLSRPDLFTHGLCRWNLNLHREGVISREERIFIDNILDKELPPKTYSIYPLLSPDYSFPCKEIQPRIDWINERIKHL